MSDELPVLAILGGTGELGTGLARRWLQAGYAVIIGSRTKEKAEAAVEELQKVLAERGVQSLNVSVAGAVILFEAQRQRRAAGMYDAPRLTPLRTREVALRWLSRSDAALLAQEPLPGEGEPASQ